MMSKHEYVNIELSHFELEMIRAIVDESTHESGYWFSQRNLDDLKDFLALECSKIPIKKAS